MRLRFLLLFCAVNTILASKAQAEDGTITIFPASMATSAAAPVSVAAPAPAPVIAAPADNVPPVVPVQVVAPADNVSSAVPVQVVTPAAATDIPPDAASAAPASEAPVESESRPRWYAAVSGSIVYLDKVKIYPTSAWTSFDFGYGYSVAGGVHIFPDVRWELEVSDRESSVHRASFDVNPPPGYVYNPNESTAIMTNAYYDLHIGLPVVPYVGAGIGDSYIRTLFYSNTTGRIDGWALSYQFMGGVSYEFTDSFAMNVGYRYVSSEDVRVSASSYSFHNTSNNVEAGIRWTFN